MGIKRYIKRVVKYIFFGVPVCETNVIVKDMSASQVLAGKKILITGGGRGLGYYIAKKSISEGADVLILGRNENTLINACKELGSKCKYLIVDIKNVSGFEELLINAEKKLQGKIDCLVSNAGISLHEGDFHNVSETDWDQQMDTNLKGNYFFVKNYIQYLETKEDTSGNIVVITSDRGRRADDIPYGLTKVAANSFIRGIAHKVISKGIRLNGVAPGVTCSDMTGYTAKDNMYFEPTPGKRLFLPEEVANVVNFLLADVSNCISGEIIACDQGFYIAHW